jgi:hypothetical protein
MTRRFIPAGINDARDVQGEVADRCDIQGDNGYSYLCRPRRLNPLVATTDAASLDAPRG